MFSGFLGSTGGVILGNTRSVPLVMTGTRGIKLLVHLHTSDLDCHARYGVDPVPRKVLCPAPRRALRRAAGVGCDHSGGVGADALGSFPGECRSSYIDLDGSRQFHLQMLSEDSLAASQL